MAEFSRTIENLKLEYSKLTDIAYEKLTANTSSDSDTMRQNEEFLRYELKKSVIAYIELQDQFIALSKKFSDLTKKNHILSNRLRENGLDNSIILKETVETVADVKKQTQVYRGIFKYDDKHTAPILQRLIFDLTPRVAITLLPGLPAYIVFMCIRWDYKNYNFYTEISLTLLRSF